MATARVRAPELPGSIEWFNVDRPVRLADLHGMLVLLDFSLGDTACSRHSQHELNRLAGRFSDELVILCAHLPELPAAMRRSHVRSLISRQDVRFPVLHDPERVCRALFGIHDQPVRILIDRDGCIVGTSHGIGKQSHLERVIAHQISLCGGWARRGPPFKVRLEPATRGTLHFPTRLIVAHDRLYIADSGNNRILMTTKQGGILREYGGVAAGFVDGPAGSAAFDNPQGLCRVDEYVYVADTGNHAIRRINLRTDEVETLAGTGSDAGQDLSKLSMPRDCVLNTPCDVLFRRGQLFIAMTGLHQVWRLSMIDNVLSIFAGSGAAGSADGPSHLASFTQPVSLAWCDGRFYCVDAGSGTVRCIDPVSGYVTTLQVGADRAGTGAAGMEQLQHPLDITSDERRKRLWIADTWNNTIRSVDIRVRPATRGVSGRRLDEPAGLAFDNNTLYIANTNAHEVLRVDTDSGRAEALNVTEEYSAI